MDPILTGLMFHFFCTLLLLGLSMLSLRKSIDALQAEVAVLHHQVAALREETRGKKGGPE